MRSLTSAVETAVDTCFCIQSIASRGTAPPEAGALATLILAGIEGALLMARASRDTEPLRTVGRELATVLTARLG